MNNRLIKITSNDVGDFLDSSGMLELAKNDCADCGNFDIWLVEYDSYFTTFQSYKCLIPYVTYSVCHTLTVTNKWLWISQKWDLFISMDKRTPCTLLVRSVVRNFCPNFTVNCEPVQIFGSVRSTMVIRLITSKSHDFRLYSWCHLLGVDQGRQNFILIRNIDRCIYDSV